MGQGTIELFRPVGPQELELIRQLDWRAFPPRLPQQPIFYPVLDEGYARQIARDWNATKPDSNYQGYVTRFQVRADYASRFPVQTVGGRSHRELWVPAEELDELNRNIVGSIEIVAAYRGGPNQLPVEDGSGST